MEPLVIILLIIILMLFIWVWKIRKSSRGPNKKEREFIEFTIDMYVKYAKELNIHSKDQHDFIIEELKKIKDKYFESNKK